MDNVHVAIRVRPLITRESNHDLNLHWRVENNSIYQVDSKNKIVGKPYTFDYVFHMENSTNDVYSQVAEPIIESAMHGYDGTIFAYGQTSSGKTFTMQGNANTPGIIPKAIQQIFTTIEKSTDREFLLRVCYMELYNEVITDLLCKDGRGLNIREQEKRVFVNGLTEEVVNNAEMIMELLKKGDQQRHVGRTNMNEHSSRSHTIFCIVIESRERTNNRQSYDGAVKVSRINLVDLAGSERINETKAEGMRLKEACKINQSLFVLGQVINKLSSGSEYIPFRDSKLTRILQPSLGGNAKTAIICTVTPAAIDQTHGTLQFASRAKTIKNKPEMHEILSDEALLRRYKTEIENLKRQIDEFDKKDKLKDGWESLENEKRQMAEENQRLIKERNRLETMVISGQGESQKTKKRPNRRETWCPGSRKFPLLSSDPISAAAAISAEVGTFDTTNTFKIPEVVSSSSSSSSVSSDEFSESKFDAFAEECASYSSDEAVPKKKRRRAVRFSEMPAFKENVSFSSHDIGCQTDDAKKDETDSSNEQLQETIIICEALMQEKEQLQNENEQMHKQITQLKEENQEINTAFITMEMDTEKVRGELQRVTQEFNELKEFTSIEQEVTDNHYKDMEIKHKSAIIELNQTIEGKDKEIKKLRRSLCVLPSTLPNFDKTEKELFVEKVKNLEHSLEDAENVVMDTNKALSEMKDTNVHLEKEMESLKKKLQQLEKEKSDFDVSMEIQKEKSDRMCADLRNELQATYRLLAEAKGEEVNEMPKNTQPSLTELQETIERLTKECEILKEDLQLSITSSVEAQEDLIICQEELEQRSNKCKALESQVASLQEKLECGRASTEDGGMLQNDELGNQKEETLIAKVQALQEELEEAKMAADRVSNEHEVELKKVLDTSAKECDSLQETIASLEEELAEVKETRVSIEESELKENKNSLEAKSLQQELEKAIISKENTERDGSETLEMQEILDAKTKEVEILNSKLVALKYELEQVTKMEQKTSDEYQTVLEMQEMLNIQQQECERYKVQIVSLQEQVEQLKTNLEEPLQNQSVSNLTKNEDEIMQGNNNVMSLQEELEQVTGETFDDQHDLQMQLKEKTEECESLHGMVNTLLEQLENAKTSTGNTSESTESELILDLQGRLKLSREYEAELESEIEMLKEQLLLVNSQGISDVNLRDELMDADVTTESNVSNIALEDVGSHKPNQIAEHRRLEKCDNIPVSNKEADNNEDIKEKPHLESKVNELQTELEVMSDLLTEMSHKVDHTEQMLKFSKDYEVELERQLEEASNNKKQRDSEFQALQDKITEYNAEKAILQTTMTDTESKLTNMESKLSESETSYADMETKLADAEKKYAEIESNLIETEAKFTDMESKLADLTSKLADSEVKVEQWKNEAEMSKRLMTEQSINSDLMSTQIENYKQTADRAKGALLAESNRELEQQKRIETLEIAQKESVAVFQQASKDKDEVIAGLEKKSRDLLTKLRQTEAESDQATHKSLQMDRECQDLRDRVKELENHAFENSQSSCKQEMDPAKLAQRMKQLEFNLDITKQKADKFEMLNKELKDSNRKYEANEFKASNLEKQLRDVNFEYERHRIQFDQLKARYDNIVVELADVQHKLAKSELKNSNVDIEGMKNDLCKLEDENRKLKERISLSDQKLLQMENAVTVDKKKCEQMKEDLKVVQDELEYCKSNINELELEKEHMQSKMEKNEKHLSNLCQELDDEVQSYKKMLEDCHGQLEEAKLKNCEYSEKLQQMEEASYNIEHQSIVTCQECEVMDKERKAQQEQIQQLETDKEALVLKIQEESESLRSIVDEKDNQLKQLNNEMSQQIDKYQKLMDEMKDQSEMNKVKAEKEVEIENLKEQLMKAEQKIQDDKIEETNILQEKEMIHISEIEKLKEEKDVENESLKEQLMKAEQKIQDIQKELEEQSIRHHEEIKTLQADAMKYMIKMETVKEEKEVANERLKELEVESKEKLESISRELAEQSSRHQHEKDTLQSTVDDLKIELGLLKATTEAVEQDDWALTKMCNDLKLELEEERQHNKQTKHLLQQEQDKYLELKSKHDTITPHLEVLKRQKHEVEQLCDQIQEEHEEEERKHKETKLQLTKLEELGMKRISEIEKLKQEKEVENDKLRIEVTATEQKIDCIHKDLEEQSIRHQDEITSMQHTLNDLKKQLTSAQAKNEAVEQDDWALSKVCNDLKVELEKEREENKQVLKEEQDKYLELKSKHDTITRHLEILNRQKHEVEQLCDQIQEEHEEEERKHKETKLQLTKLETTFSEVKSKFGKVNEGYEKIKIEKKEEEKELKNTKAKLGELQAKLLKNKNLADENTLKNLQQELLEKKMKIVSLENDILKCTDPLEKRISQLTKELADSSEKVESWKNEVKRLRKQSLDSKGDGSASLRTEAGSGYGIIQECAVFTLKAEKAKLEQELKKSKNKVNDLEKKYNEKCMFYQEEITRSTRLRAELKRCMEKLKKVEAMKEPTQKMPDAVQKRPLADIPTNSPVKKASRIQTTIERLPTSNKSEAVKPTSSNLTSTNLALTTTGSKKTAAKTNDWDNFLQPAIDKLNEDDKPQQCTQQ